MFRKQFGYLRKETQLAYRMYELFITLSRGERKWARSRVMEQRLFTIPTSV